MKVWIEKLGRNIGERHQPCEAAELGEDGRWYVEVEDINDLSRVSVACGHRLVIQPLKGGIIRLEVLDHIYYNLIFQRDLDDWRS